jgi:hypothetical protein
MTCTNGICEYKPTLNRGKINRIPNPERYGRLYAKIELPEQLKGEK